MGHFVVRRGRTRTHRSVTQDIFNVHKTMPAVTWKSSFGYWLTILFWPSNMRQMTAGRKKIARRRKRDFRANLLLNDQEEVIWKRWLTDIAAETQKPTSGSRLLYELVYPHLWAAARRYGLPLEKREEVNG